MSQTGHQLNLDSELSIDVSPEKHDSCYNKWIDLFFSKKIPMLQMKKKLTSLITQTLAVKSHQQIWQWCYITFKATLAPQNIW